MRFDEDQWTDKTDFELEVLKDYNTNKYTLRALAQKHECTLSKIQRIIDKHKIKKVINQAVAKKVEKHKNQQAGKLLTQETENAIKNRSVELVENYLNVLQTINHAVSESIQINDQAKALSESVPEQLKELIQYLESGINEQLFEDEKEANLARQNIYKTISNISDFYSKMDIRIKSLTELGRWVDRFVKYEEERVIVRTLTDIVETFFKGLNILDEENYQKVKRYVIEKNPGTANYFNQYETIPEYEIFANKH